MVWMHIRACLYTRVGPSRRVAMLRWCGRFRLDSISVWKSRLAVWSHTCMDLLPVKPECNGPVSGIEDF